MAHPNAGLLRRAYEAAGTGDLQPLPDVLADDITWRDSSLGPLAGEYHGKDDVLAFFGKMAEVYAGTLRLDVHDILANDEHTAVLCNLSATRGNKSVATQVVNVSHTRDGRITEFWSATTDPQAALDFWA